MKINLRRTRCEPANKILTNLPTNCEVANTIKKMKFLMHFDENFVRFQQYRTNDCGDEKIRVQGLAFSTRFFSGDQNPGFGFFDTIFVFFNGFLSLFHQNFVFFVKLWSIFIIRQGLGFSFFELLVGFRVQPLGAQFRAPVFHPE